MRPLKILYVGPDRGTSRHRFRALARLGHDVRLVDPFGPIDALPRARTRGIKTGYAGFERAIERHVVREAGPDRFDVVWVDNGETVGRSLARRLKEQATHLLNHNLDNPFTARDGWRWRLFRSALPVYDLFVTPRETSRTAALAQGARRALAVMFTADEVVHRSVALSAGDRAAFGSDVAFVGTWMPERGPFMLRLLERGVPLRIFGPRWTKAPEYARLASIVTARDLDDTDYVKAVSGAKIALGLLSSGNEDLHTTRSLEIPAIGTAFCAPRTSDHARLYDDGREALFFDTPDGCADTCLAALADDAGRQALARAGHERAVRNGYFNERLCSDILAAL
jgi:spore maturation protein CgeB